MRISHAVDDQRPSDDALEALMTVCVCLSESSKAVILNGAGTSTNAGLPDFRSKGSSSSGIYSQHPLVSPSSRSSNATTYSTKELFSYSSLLKSDTRSAHLKFMADLHQKGSEVSVREDGAPTVFHSLMKRLDEMDKLLRVYSQNVDGFEEKSGLGLVQLEEAQASGSGIGCDTPDPSQEDSTSDYEDSLRHRPVRKRRKLSRSSPSKFVDSHQWANLPRGQKVVAVHGSLNSVVCAACGWKGDWDERIQRRFGLGKKVSCPRCESRSNRRLSASKRPLPPSTLAFLRPALLLYDDPSSLHSCHLSSLSSLSSYDLTEGQPDFLLVAGTSLQIPGFKHLVKEFARAVRDNGGICVLVNREPVAALWDAVFDYEFRMDTDAFATSILSNLSCLAPVDSICPTELPSPSSTPFLESSVPPSPPRITPSPQRTILNKLSKTPTYLPTPSPTPSISESKPILASSPSLVSLCDTSSPSSASQLSIEPGIPKASIASVPTFELRLASSPPPSSTPLRSRSHSRHRPVKIRLPTPEESIAEDSSSEDTSDEEDNSQDERVLTERESRNLVHDLLREAQGIWENSQVRRK
ncbi:hypothetical protein JCM5353_008751 [Sporobolomyces roseus]